MKCGFFVLCFILLWASNYAVNFMELPIPPRCHTISQVHAYKYQLDNMVKSGENYYEHLYKILKQSPIARVCLNYLLKELFTSQREYDRCPCEEQGLPNKVVSGVPIPLHCHTSPQIHDYKLKLKDLIKSGEHYYKHLVKIINETGFQCVNYLIQEMITYQKHYNKCPCEKRYIAARRSFEGASWLSWGLAKSRKCSCCHGKQSTGSCCNQNSNCNSRHDMCLNINIQNMMAPLLGNNDNGPSLSLSQLHLMTNHLINGANDKDQNIIYNIFFGLIETMVRYSVYLGKLSRETNDLQNLQIDNKEQIIMTLKIFQIFIIQVKTEFNVLFSNNAFLWNYVEKSLVTVSEILEMLTSSLYQGPVAPSPTWPGPIGSGPIWPAPIGSEATWPGPVSAGIPSPGPVRPVILSPDRVRPAIPSPGRVRPVILSPDRVRPVILSPDRVRPVIPSPGRVRPVILSPDRVRPVIPSPDRVRPVIPSPDRVRPVILSPGRVRPVILSPDRVRPVILSPDRVRPVIPSPGRVRPVIPSPGRVRPVILSPDRARPVILSPYRIRPVIPSSGLIKPKPVKETIVRAIRYIEQNVGSVVMTKDQKHILKNTRRYLVRAVKYVERKEYYKTTKIVKILKKILKTLKQQIIISKSTRQYTTVSLLKKIIVKIQMITKMVEEQRKNEIKTSQHIQWPWGISKINSNASTFASASHESNQNMNSDESKAWYPWMPVKFHPTPMPGHRGFHSNTISPRNNIINWFGEQHQKKIINFKKKFGGSKRTTEKAATLLKNKSIKVKQFYPEFLFEKLNGKRKIAASAAHREKHHQHSVKPGLNIPPFLEWINGNGEEMIGRQEKFDTEEGVMSSVGITNRTIERKDLAVQHTSSSSNSKITETKEFISDLLGESKELDEPLNLSIVIRILQILFEKKRELREEGFMNARMKRTLKWINRRIHFYSRLVKLWARRHKKPLPLIFSQLMTEKPVRLTGNWLLERGHKKDIAAYEQTYHQMQSKSRMPKYKSRARFLDYLQKIGKVSNHKRQSVKEIRKQFKDNKYTSNKVSRITTGRLHTRQQRAKVGNRN